MAACQLYGGMSVVWRHVSRMAACQLYGGMAVSEGSMSNYMRHTSGNHDCEREAC